MVLTDGDEESGTGGDEFRDTQEEEFESEEQWRKQRHERETFLRQMVSPRKEECFKYGAIFCIPMYLSKDFSLLWTE